MSAARTTEQIREDVALWYATTTPEEKAAMWAAQRESFARAMAPCEHGDPDWETCPQCLSAFAAKREQTQ